MNLDKYANFSIEDYLDDEAFRERVLKPEPGNDTEWEALFIRYPEQQKIAHQARIFLLQMEEYFQPPELKVKPLDPVFIEKLKQKVEESSTLSVREMPQRIPLRRISVAATVFLAIGIATWLFLFNPANMLTIRTDYGQWKTYTLPDGSVVNLNAHSEIRFAKAWKKGADREVWLKGEAYFDVTKDPQRARFTVFTEELAVEVLGTSFNVHSRNQHTKVFLEEGEIRLDMGESEKLLAPGEFVSYSAPKKAIVASKSEPAELHTSWKNGAIIMKDKSVKQVFCKLEEIYGLKVRVENPELLTERKTIAIPLDKVELAIPILEKVLGLQFRMENGQWVAQ